MILPARKQYKVDDSRAGYQSISLRLRSCLLCVILLKTLYFP